jgi:hypothetical protein
MLGRDEAATALASYAARHARARAALKPVLEAALGIPVDNPEPTPAVLVIGPNPARPCCSIPGL